MPDEADRFGGLSDAIQEEEVEGEDRDENGAGAELSTAAADTSPEQTEDATAVKAEGSTEEFPEPFGFPETSQQSYYVRDETFGPISANRSRVRAVASKHGLDEDQLSKRELHDAELSVLQSFEDWDIAVAIEVLERRGVDVNEDSVRAVFDVLR